MASKKKTAPTVPWACPECGAKAGKHGRGECLSGGPGRSCDGFICECDSEGSDEHGATFADPCPSANCQHCGHGCIFPTPPKGLQAWEKKALAAGWTPPEARAAELGMVAK